MLVGVRIHYQENEATADDLVRCVVEHPLRGRDLALHQAPLVSGDHALRDAVQNAARELLAGQKLLPGGAAAARAVACERTPRADGGALLTLLYGVISCRNYASRYYQFE